MTIRDMPGATLTTEFISLREAVEQYPFSYSSLRAWVRSGVIPGFRLPNGRVFLRRNDIETKLFKPVQN
jgi:predicted site-specific integrase-resolvase